MKSECFSSEISRIEDYKKSLMEAIKTKDKELVIDILPKLYVNCGDSLLDFLKYYKKNNQNDILVDIESIYSGNFKILLLALFQDPIEYDCSLLRKSLEGIGINQEILIEIFATRTPATIRKIKKRYSELYPGSTLLEDVKDNTSGYFRDLLVSLIECDDVKDKYDYFTQRDLAEELAQENYKRYGSEDNFFLNIFTKTSTNDFYNINFFYNVISDEHILDVIKKKYSFKSLKLLKAIFFGRLHPYDFFAKKIHKALTGIITDYDLLTRVIVTQRNKGKEYMRNIMNEYKIIYNNTDMVEDIISNTTGSYRLLISFLLP